MSISELSETTIEELCFALEKCPALNWKVLMGWFHPLYSEDHIAIIERSESPAKALLVYLDHKEIPLKDLVNGLKAIGNKKAVSIIKKGAEKSGLDIQYSGGRPPRQVPQFSAGHSREYKNFSCVRRKEQSETLPFPVQESEATGHLPILDTKLR
ncbi:hypothetical protein ACROYT_G006096 [Oculina patagonica]